MIFGKKDNRKKRGGRYLAAATVFIAAALLLCSCGIVGKKGTADTGSGAVSVPGTVPGTAVDPSEMTKAADAEDNRVEITSDFKIVQEKGSGGYSVSGSVVTVTAAGTYTLTGSLSGRIEVNAGEDDEVELDLGGCSISCSDGAPIAFLSCGEAKIKALEGTYNEISDSRPARTEESSGDEPAGAVYSVCDLRLSGSGSLSVTGTYNNGIHSKKDLSVKNMTLKVTARNNALKGKDSVEIGSGELIIISTGGDGIQTEDSDISSKGNQRGTVAITGGNVNIYAACDGIDAAYNVEIGGTAAVSVLTGSYSKYSGEIAASSGTDFYIIVPTAYYSDRFTYAAYYYNDDPNGGVWAKAAYDCMVSSGRTRYYGMKLKAPSGYANVAFYRLTGEPGTADPESVTRGGSINETKNAYLISSVASGIISGDWVSMTSGQGSGTQYSCKGVKADNEVVISGGSLLVSSTDDAVHANSDVPLENGATPLGNVTVSGGTLTLTTGDDGIHADGELKIDGGTVNVLQSYEGLEGNLVTVNGGSVIINANDDGVNATAGRSSPLISVNGGYLEVTTRSGDTDGLDSNGSITVTGGFTLVKGGSSQGGMAGSVDCDGRITVTGGTIVAFGGICELPSGSSVCTVTMNGKTFAAGEYKLMSGSDEVLSFTLPSKYSNCWICSDKIEQGGSYRLTAGGSEAASWTQSSVTVQNGSAVSGGFGGGGFEGGGFGGGGFGGGGRH